MPDRGTLYVAYGRPAINQFYVARRHLGRVHPDWPVAVISDAIIPDPPGMGPFETICFPDHDPGARWAKLHMDLLSPWKQTLYMDADTRVRYPIGAIWEILDAGWDMVAVPTANHGENGAMRHIYMEGNEIGNEEGLEERNVTVAEIGWPYCGWQGGVVGFNANDRTRMFFETWREEWQRWRDQDQPGFARAYRRQPVKMFPLGRAFNGGSKIGHFHAHARRHELRGSLY